MLDSMLPQSVECILEVINLLLALKKQKHACNNN